MLFFFNSFKFLIEKILLYHNLTLLRLEKKIYNQEVIKAVFENFENKRQKSSQKIIHSLLRFHIINF